MTPRLARLRRFAAALLVLPLLAFAAPAAAPRAFDLPAETGDKSLARFAAQSGLEVVFGSATAAQVRTNAVKGTYLPRAALDLLLANTGLVASTDPRSGALTISRDPNGPRATPAPAVARPGVRVPGSEETLVLSPFEVSTARDTGYVASTSLAGRRINAELWTTPAAISVMTKEFIEDTGALDVKSVLDYSLNASFDYGDVTGASSAHSDFGALQIRGFRDAQLGRNYFLWRLNSDRFNVERLDFSRGPNSVLYGQGSPGGIVNTSTKRARIGRDGEAVTLPIGSFDDYRGEIDVERTLAKDKLAARLNLMYQDRQGYREFEQSQRSGAAFAATWKPFKSTEIRLDGEYGDINQVVALPWPAHELYDAWVRSGSQPSVTYGQAVPGTGAVAQANRVVWNPYAGIGPIPYVGSRATNSGGAGPLGSPAIILDESIAPKRSSIAGPGYTGDFHYFNYAAFIEQRVGEYLALELAYNRQAWKRWTDRPIGFNQIGYKIDVNRLRPKTFNANGTVATTEMNPFYGMFYTESLSDHRLIMEDTSADDWRVTASYRLDFTKRSKWFGRHDFAGLLSRTDVLIDGDPQGTQQMVNITPHLTRAALGIGANIYPDNLTNGNNRINRRAYIDFSNPDPKWHGLYDYRKHLLRGRPEDNGVTEAFVRVLDGDQHDLDRTDTQMLVLQSHWLGSRLIATAGYRQDKLRAWYDENYVRDANGNIRKDPTTGAELTTTTATTDAVTGAWSERRRGDVFSSGKGPTRTYGAVLAPLRWVALAYNRSESFKAQTASQDVFGGALPNRAGIGNDYGVRLRFNDRFFVNYTYWTIDDTGNIASGLSGNWFSYVNALFHIRNQAAAGRALPGVSNSSPVDRNARDTQTLSGRGHELEFVANPTPNWRLTFNVSQNFQSTALKYPVVQRFMEVYKGEFDALVRLPSANPGDVGRVDETVGNFPTGTAANYLNSAYGELALARLEEGQTRRQLREWNGGLFTNYSFRSRDSWLRGLGLGGGVQYQGAHPIGYDAARNNVAVLSDDFFLLNLVASYETRLWKKRTKFQLNIDNVLKEDDMIEIDGTPDLVYRYRLQKPRTWSLSMRVAL
jgi:outer membrane receptor protein involved in Fe transport